MDEFDHFAGHVLQAEDLEQLPAHFRDACVRDRQTLLRAASNRWYQSYLPQFEAIAAQLRKEAAQRDEDARLHLRLAQRFDELAEERRPSEPTPDEDRNSD